MSGSGWTAAQIYRADSERVEPVVVHEDLEAGLIRNQELWQVVNAIERPSPGALITDIVEASEEPDAPVLIDEVPAGDTDPRERWRRVRDGLRRSQLRLCPGRVRTAHIRRRTLIGIILVSKIVVHRRELDTASA